MSKRRGRGEGSIFQRADGLWCAVHTMGYDGTGRRRRRYVYGTTKAEVQEKLTRVKADDLNGTLSDAGAMKLSDYLDRWLEDSARSTIRRGTYLNYKGAIKTHINPKIGGTKLAKLTPAHVSALYAEMQREGASGHVRVLTHAVLNRALKQAMKWGLVPRNVCDAVDKPKVPTREIKVWSEKEVATFLKAAKGHRLYALFVLALATGLRQGELLGLQWQDIDLKGGSLSVCRQLLENAGALSFGEPKSAKGRRKIDLPQMAVVALKKHRERILAEGHRASGLVFCDSEGGPIRKSNLTRRVFHPLVETAEVPRIRFHDLRHTAATLLLAQGVHPKVVQERLGHSQISVTLDTYSHVLPSMQKEAARKLNKLLAGA